MRVTMLLADAAQVVENKLYILGGGWSITGPGPTAFAMAMKIAVPWTEANRRHSLELQLVDDDGRPVLLPTGSTAAPQPFTISGEFAVGRPVGVTEGMPLDLALVLAPGGSVQFPPDRHLSWRLTIDGASNEDWQIGFLTRPSG